jgi:hypothetical protein
MIAKTLIVVHPGSMYGSARACYGRSEAEGFRANVLMEIGNHDGHLFVIDGAFSDEIYSDDDEIIVQALRSAKENDHQAKRLWGCDAGEEPFEGWNSFGDGRLVFKSQEEAVSSIALSVQRSMITVTGAWATEDLSSGCVSSVVNELNFLFGNKGNVLQSENAILEPNDDGPEPS